MFNELAATRTGYIELTVNQFYNRSCVSELTFKENVNLIFLRRRKQLWSRTWLSEQRICLRGCTSRLSKNFLNKNTHLDSDKQCQVLDRIFDKRMVLSLKNKIESKIKGKQKVEITQTFELFTDL